MPDHVPDHMLDHLRDPSLIETKILGYRIDRVDRERADACCYEVIGPDECGVLAIFADRPAAEQFVVLCELRSIEMRPRSPAY